MSSNRSIMLILAFALLAGGGLLPLAAQQAEGKKYALLVGVNRYDFEAEFPDLHGAVNDAVRLGELLKQQGYTVALLTDEKATRANIEAELGKLKERSTREDLILIGLAGHGESIGADSYFCPREARKAQKDKLLALNSLGKELSNIRGKAKLVLVDACREDGRGAVDASGVPAQVGMLFSCSPGQRAFETKDKQHGVFFQHIIRGMDGEAKNAKGDVTWAGLRAYVIDRVPAAAAKESPGAKQIPRDVSNVAEVPPLATTLTRITNSIGMKLAYIAPGKFQMGSPNAELQRDTNEFQHEVELTKGFHMGVYAVTQEEYETVMEKNPSWFCADGDGKASVAGLDTRRFPVETVSWDDAKAFCRKLGAKEGKTYRLPTEAEWEYACRAGTTTPFHCGETISTDQANYNGEFVYGDGKKGKNRKRTMKVGSFAPNAWGLYDMHGNVYQWCEDWYDAKYYENSPKSNPLNETKSAARVMRGGAFNFIPWFCRSASRYYYPPVLRNDDNFGFRVVLLPSP